MPTYAQLQAEPWWGREIVTPELSWLGGELCRRTRRPAAAFGVKGDNNHLRGAHRSQEWIERSRYCTSRTYTAQSGLTATQKRHLAGVDFTPGSAAEMVAQCKRIYAAMRAGRLDEVREFYGNVDGDRVVDGWDNVRDRAASSDSSHLWHWHLTIDRRHCANKRLMERILAIALGDDLEDEVSAQDVVRGLETPVEWQSDGVAKLAARLNMSKKDTRSLVEMVWEATHLTRAEMTALRSVVETLAETIRSGGGSVDTVAILAGVDERLERLAADTRDAVADLGEGGAKQVRAGSE